MKTSVTLPTFDGDLVLFGSSTSPFVRKVRVALIEKQLPYRFEMTPPWSPSAGIERLNPLRKVPTLGLGDGSHLVDSRVIVQYLETRQPTPPMLPSAAAENIAALQMEALADGIGEAVALWTQEGWRSPGSRSDFWLDRQRAKVADSIAVLDQCIGPWLPRAGEYLPLVPIAVGAALGFASFWMPDLRWRDDAPNLGQLMDGLEARDSWRQTAPYLVAGATFPRL